MLFNVDAYIGSANAQLHKRWACLNFDANEKQSPGLLPNISHHCLVLRYRIAY